MNNSANVSYSTKNQSHMSISGYEFDEDSNYWQLDKNNNVAVGTTRDLMDTNLRDGFTKTLVYFATNMSASYTNNICLKVLRLLRITEASTFNENMLINYRSSLSSNEEWQLGTIKSFLNKWSEFGYFGINEELIELLYSWSLKGAVKGDVVKRMDPLNGPLTDIERHSFNDGVVQAYEKNLISISELVMCLLTSNTGRRSIQISHLKIKDVLEGTNKRSEKYFVINIPKAKQRSSGFREFFNQFAISDDLWLLLNTHISSEIEKVRDTLSFVINKSIQLELPLFPDIDAIKLVISSDQLVELLASDKLHIPANKVTEVIKKCAAKGNVFSERTGEPLKIFAKRFRYTMGTKASREGKGKMVIAELLDHSDTQNAHIYIENSADHVLMIDAAVGHHLAPFAQAFAGVLIDSEKDAVRGNDLNSRIKLSGVNIANCGSYSFCGANVPIPCYTCIHFQPWLDAPHQLLYDEMVAESNRILEMTGDAEIASVNNRTILAIAQVIQLCDKRRRELDNE